MATASERDRVLQELETVAAGERSTDLDLYQAFTKCKKLQKPSAILARACEQLDVDGRHVGAFTAATSTPLQAPPGWLPPPI
jgi:hypothetical protein